MYLNNLILTLILPKLNLLPGKITLNAKKDIKQHVIGKLPMILLKEPSN